MTQPIPATRDLASFARLWTLVHQDFYPYISLANLFDLSQERIRQLLVGHTYLHNEEYLLVTNFDPTVRLVVGNIYDASLPNLRGPIYERENFARRTIVDCRDAMVGFLNQ